MTISADSTVHMAKEGRYELKGNVVIEHQGAIIKAQQALVYESSLDTVAEGKVYYEDKDALINAERAEINLSTKTGKVYKAVIFFKEGNYWLSSESITKISEDRYFAESARFTTCNPAVSKPSEYTYEMAETERYDWCFHGKKIDIVLGSNIDASDVTFRVKDRPIGFSPKLWAPIRSERTSGLLMPAIGNSSQRGIRFAPSFFWAIDEDKDMTIGLDIYSKRGIGKYAQFRYIEPNGKGEINVYHLRDRVMDDTQIQVTGQQELRRGAFREFIDVNYAKSTDMFKEYTFSNQDRTQRFLQSSAEIGMDLRDSRLYILGQHWIDMKQSDTYIPQRLPELGYVLYPSRFGPFMFEMESSLTNFYRENGVRAQRFDIMPSISHSFGDAVQFYQSLSLRESAYNLHNSPDDSNQHRETLRYRAQALSRFVKRYESFEHIIEPSVEYTFIPSRIELPTFDVVEEFNNISQARFSLLNLLRFREMLVAARISQPYDLKETDYPNRLRPTIFQGAIIGKPFVLRLETSYDINSKKMETLYTDLSLPISSNTNIVFGERYSRQDNIMQYRTALDSELSSRWAVSANIWYDTKGGGLRDSNLKIRYTEQCWAANVTVNRRPRYNDQSADYSFLVLLELKGIGSIGKK